MAKNTNELFASYLEARISVGALQRNLSYLQSLFPDSKICTALKADAYGHDLAIVATALINQGVGIFAVSNFSEAQQLLDAKVKSPVLVFGSQFSMYSSSQRKDIAKWIIENDVRITAMREEDMVILDSVASELDKKAKVHVLYDTGMSRMGLIREPMEELVKALNVLPNINIEGVYTHFPMADLDDNSFTIGQIEKFKNFLDYLKNNSIKYEFAHMFNSPATLSIEDTSCEFVRSGLALYGYYDGPFKNERPPLKPALKLVSRIAAVKEIKKGSRVSYGGSYQAEKDMQIALVPVGYADGYDRDLSNKGKMKIGEDYVNVVGRVTMDQTIIDVTDLAARGDDLVGKEVVIIDDNHDSENSVENLARLLGQIPYEFVSRLGQRIKRVAVD